MVESAAALNMVSVVLVVIVLFIFVVTLVIYYLYRNRGGNYSVRKKECQAGHDLEKELKHGDFPDAGLIFKWDDEEKAIMDESISIDKTLSKDSDRTEDDDFDLSDFNEEGSFIGMYGKRKGRQGKKEKRLKPKGHFMN